MLTQLIEAVAPLAGVPRNPSIFEQWVLEPINFQPNKPEIAKKTVFLEFAIQYCYLKDVTDLFLIVVRDE